MRYDVTFGGVTIASYAGRDDLEISRAMGMEPTGATVVAVASADDVRAECARRLRVLIGARDDTHMGVHIANASREAIRLLRIQSERAWTPQEAARAAGLEGMDAAVEAIRAVSNVLEVNPPADYADDARWPA